MYGREHPAGGGWGFGLATPSDPDKFTAGVLCGRLLIEGGNRDEAIRTWIATVSITAANRDLAASLEAIVKEHLGAIGPARLSNDDASILLPFRISQDSNPRAFAGQTGLHLDGDNHVSIGSAGTCFLANGWKYHWRDAVSLVDVPRSQLPEIELNAVRPLILAAEDYLESQRPPAPPTGLQLRMRAAAEKARLHREQCQDQCARCHDSKVGQWVVVRYNGRQSPAVQIAAFDGVNYTVKYQGKSYSSNGQDMFPTDAPAPVVETVKEAQILVGGFHRAPMETNT
jgi:hypothetical protein